MVTAALNGELEKAEFEKDPIFGLAVPKSCPGVPSEFLSQKALWQNDEAYEAAAKELAQSFIKNFKKYSNMPDVIVNAGPKAE